MYQNVGISDVSSTGREVKEVVGFKNGWLWLGGLAAFLATGGGCRVESRLGKPSIKKKSRFYGHFPYPP